MATGRPDPAARPAADTRGLVDLPYRTDAYRLRPGARPTANTRRNGSSVVPSARAG